MGERENFKERPRAEEKGKKNHGTRSAPSSSSYVFDLIGTRCAPFRLYFLTTTCNPRPRRCSMMRRAFSGSCSLPEIHRMSSPLRDPRIRGFTRIAMARRTARLAFHKRISSIIGAFCRNAISSRGSESTQYADSLFNPSMEIHGLEGSLLLELPDPRYARRLKIRDGSSTMTTPVETLVSALIRQSVSSVSGIYNIFRKLHARSTWIHPKTRCFSAGRCTNGI